MQMLWACAASPSLREALADGLKSNGSLQKLELRNNSIGDAGLEAPGLGGPPHGGAEGRCWGSWTTLELWAARPHGLPPSPVELEGISDGPTGHRPGKGRGGQPTGAGRGCYATPPSHWKSSEPNSAVPLEGNCSEGVMPPTGDKVLKSMGRVPHGDEDKPPGELQRALEAEIVDHLRTQNAQLMEELDRLRNLQSQQGSASNSNSSWVEVGRESGSVGKGHDEGRGRTGYHTPRSSTQTGMGKLDRFTPNGTKVS
eukprot:s1434_g23.t1